MRKTQYNAAHWLARAHEARAAADALLAASKTRKILLGLAVNYERLARAASERAAQLKQRAPTMLTKADKLLLQAEEYRAIADGMAHSAARASMERMAQDCERAAEKSQELPTTRTPEVCLLMAEECDAFASGFSPEGRKALRRVAQQWRSLALRGTNAAG